MIFTSFNFLVFAFVVISIFFIVPFKVRWVILLCASYFFYMYAKPAYGLLLLYSTVVSYVAGFLISSASCESKKKLYLYAGLLLNLSSLIFFKYVGFLGNSINYTLGVFGSDYMVSVLSVALPVGISFFVFQTMSYDIEVYRGTIKHEKHFGIYSLFASFFPTLLAGPIERAGNLLPQFKIEHKFNIERVLDGLKLILWGLFKKLVVADRLVPMVNYVYDNPTSYTGIPLILATVLFAFQIYCDFSAYSDIAIGVAKIMGFNLMDNFKRPYFSKSIPEFWRRWHISLSSWLKDYIYIPLGGSRVVKWRWYYNLFITFFISGLWHGAAWTFVIWGALHGGYMIMSNVTAGARSKIVKILRIERLPFLYKIFRVVVTFSLVCFAWIFFRAGSVGDAFYIVKNLFVGGLGQMRLILTDSVARGSLLFLGQTKIFFLITVFSVLFMEFVHLIQRHGSIRSMLKKRSLSLKFAVYFFLIFSTILFSYSETYQFIYFQF